MSIRLKLKLHQAIVVLGTVLQIQLLVLDMEELQEDLEHQMVEVVCLLRLIVVDMK